MIISIRNVKYSTERDYDYQYVKLNIFGIQDLQENSFHFMFGGISSFVTANKFKIRNSMKEIEITDLILRNFGDHSIVDVYYNAKDIHLFDTIVCTFTYTIGHRARAVAEFEFELEVSAKRTPFKHVTLDSYDADEQIRTLFNKQFQPEKATTTTEKELLQKFDDFYKQSIEQRINSGCHYEMLKRALKIEDLEILKDFDKFQMKDVELSYRRGTYKFAYDATLFSESPDIVIKDLSLKLTVCSKKATNNADKDKKNKDEIFVYVSEVTKTAIYFERFGKRININERYNIQFLPNRLSFRASFRALELIQQHDLIEFFTDFKSKSSHTKMRPLHMPKKLRFFNEKIGNNEEQHLAIQKIANRSTYPYPLVVFGPPGTGKTSVIVEAVAQILASNPHARILITAQSNYACDEVAVRLLKYIARSKMYRYYSKSFEMNSKDIPSILLGISNIQATSSRRTVLSQEEFEHFNVFIVTCVSSNRFFQQKKFRRPFDFVFIDEAGACSEPEILIPITGFATSFREITSYIVLFGDHKQLGPIVKSEFAERLGLNVSLMERILNTPKYQTDRETYCVQLLDNYRSHPAILEFPNKSFYDSKLRSKLPTEQANTFVNWPSLPNRDVPIIFHSIFQPSVQEGFSWYNEDEVYITRFYVDLLLGKIVNGRKVTAKDIGIVTPYRAQQTRMVTEHEDCPGIEIGTAEHFQGREKNIIILSTVKSGPGISIGFLKNEKRLNVVLTRAKYLLIVVSNPINLQRDPQWRSFIEFCVEKNVCFGDKIQLRQVRQVEKTPNEKKSFFALPRQKKMAENDDIVEALTLSGKKKTLLNFESPVKPPKKEEAVNPRDISKQFKDVNNNVATADHINVSLSENKTSFNQIMKSLDNVVQRWNGVPKSSSKCYPEEAENGDPIKKRRKLIRTNFPTKKILPEENKENIENVEPMETLPIISTNKINSKEIVPNEVPALVELETEEKKPFMNEILVKRLESFDINGSKKKLNEIIGDRYLDLELVNVTEPLQNILNSLKDTETKNQSIEESVTANCLEEVAKETDSAPATSENEPDNDDFLEFLSNKISEYYCQFSDLLQSSNDTGLSFESSAENLEMTGESFTSGHRSGNIDENEIEELPDINIIKEESLSNDDRDLQLVNDSVHEEKEEPGDVNVDFDELADLFAELTISC